MPKDCKEPTFPTAPLVLTDDERVGDAAVDFWMRAARFRRRANRLLRPLGVSFGAWRVLYAIDRLVRKKGDAINEVEVMVACELDANTISAHVRRLTKQGLLDVGLDGWAWAYRIYVTKNGKALLAAAGNLVVEAARDTEVVPHGDVALERRAG
jgi:DNA-binding MarR family transcriptional regulator